MKTGAIVETARRVLRSRWVKVFQAAVTLLLIGWICISIDSQVWSSLTQVSLQTLIVASVLFGSAQIVGGLRLAVLIPRVFPWREAMAATWAGYFWANFLPGSIGGDFVRAFRLNRSGVSLPGAAGALILDRVFNLAAIGTVVLASAWELSLRASPVAGGRIAAISAGLVVIGAGLVLLSAGTRFRSIFSRSFEPFLHVARSPRHFLAALLLSFCNIGVSIAAQWLVARNLGFGIGFLHLAGIICLVTLLVMLPISINGLGLQEASFATLLISSGVVEEKAIAFSLLVRFLIFLTSAFAGLTILARHIRPTTPAKV